MGDKEITQLNSILEELSIPPSISENRICETYADFIDYKDNDVKFTWFQKKVFDEGECDKIVDYVTSLGTNVRQEGTTLGDTLGAGVVGNRVWRKSVLVFLPKTEAFMWVYKKIGETIKDINNKHYKFDLYGMMEDLQYGEYDSSYKGFYDWHMDLGRGSINKRKISISIQLSDEDDYEGGELQFQIGRNIEIAPKSRGSGIVFPSFFCHKVTPVTKGVRKSLVLWVSGPTFR